MRSETVGIPEPTWVIKCVVKLRSDREPRVVNEADLPPPLYRQERLEVANGRLRLVVIAVLVVMLAGFALLGIQFRQLNARIDQLATKVNDIDATFRVKFD